MTFDLGTILSVTTGYNLAPNGFGDVCVLLDHMTGESLSDIGRVAMQKRCAEALITQFPALAGVEPPRDFGPQWRGWCGMCCTRRQSAAPKLPHWLPCPGGGVAG
jgi:hypothetical protein